MNVSKVSDLLFGSLFSVVIAIVLPSIANATLLVDGTVDIDGQQVNLIYDDGLDLTWLDYTHAGTEWMTANSWAENLSFEINGKIFDHWKLPDTVREKLRGRLS